MNKPSKLLRMMFETERWQRLLDKSTDKGIDLKTIKDLCMPEEREKLFSVIINDEYNIFPPHIAKIPKDTSGEFREVYVNEPRDRIVLTIINDCLFELFGYKIHSHCVSYKKGTGTQQIIKEISNKIVNLSYRKIDEIGYKADFSKYFDNVKIAAIDNLFDEIEELLGFDKDTEPVINMLRRYYHQDLYFDTEGNLCKRYQGLKQGCAVASFLADIILYDLDKFMSNKYKIYYRYCDDVVIIDRHTSNVINEMNEIISKYGVTLNPKKVEKLYKDKWFKFLGFNIKGRMISLSSSRIKKFQKEIEKRSIKNKNCSGNQARKQIIKYLYDGDYCWANSCLSIINVEHDIQELNKFIMDCIRACETKKKRLGGLGCSFEHGDYTILRGKGRNVRSNRNKCPHIENYNTLMCMKKLMYCGKPVFQMAVRDMLR